MANDRTTKPRLVDVTDVEAKGGVLIQFVDAMLPDIVDRAMQALVDAGVEVFARGSQLVRPVTVAPAGQRIGVTRRESSVLLVPVEEHGLTELLTRNISWRKFDARRDDWKPISAPPVVAKTILARKGDWPFRQLTAVVTAPTLRPDMTPIEKAGYDEATGIYFASDVTDWIRLAAKPTRDDAERGLGLLRKLLKDFPFVSPADQSAGVAMILTALIRASLPTAPLFGVSAPVPGSGKSKLVDLASVLATGRVASVMSASRDEQEMQKALGAALMGGDNFINLDNCEHALRGEFLCQALTQSSLKIRVLGQSLNVDTPTTATICATGNGLRFAGDLVRRVTLIALDPGVERPEDRVFDLDAVIVARRSRPKLVHAGLTVLRAFAVSGAAPKRPALGSFEMWSDTVRSALLWLGAADPLGNAERVREDDPEKERTSTIIRALPRGEWTATEVAEMVNSDLSRPDAQRSHSALVEALSEFVERQRMDPGRLGYWLRKHRDRIVDGLRVTRAGERNHVALWRVIRPKSEEEPPNLDGW